MKNVSKIMYVLACLFILNGCNETADTTKEITGPQIDSSQVKMKDTKPVQACSCAMVADFIPKTENQLVNYVDRTVVNSFTNADTIKKIIHETGSVELFPKKNGVIGIANYKTNENVPDTSEVDIWIMTGKPGQFFAEDLIGKTKKALRVSLSHTYECEGMTLYTSVAFLYTPEVARDLLKKVAIKNKLEKEMNEGKRSGYSVPELPVSFAWAYLDAIYSTDHFFTDNRMARYEYGNLNERNKLLHSDQDIMYKVLEEPEVEDMFEKFALSE